LQSLLASSNVIQGRDVIAQAQHSTGKMVSSQPPSFSLLMSLSARPRCLYSCQLTSSQPKSISCTVPFWPSVHDFGKFALWEGWKILFRFMVNFKPVCFFGHDAWLNTRSKWYSTCVGWLYERKMTCMHWWHVCSGQGRWTPEQGIQRPDLQHLPLPPATQSHTPHTTLPIIYWRWRWNSWPTLSTFSANVINWRSTESTVLCHSRNGSLEVWYTCNLYGMLTITQAVIFCNTWCKVRRKHCFRWWQYYLLNSNLGGLTNRGNACS
jgi:hypothetical protein